MTCRDGQRALAHGFNFGLAGIGIEQRQVLAHRYAVFSASSRRRFSSASRAAFCSARAAAR